MGLYPGTDVWPNVSLWPEAGSEAAPTVTTSAVTNVTSTTATFAGTVDPNGLSAKYYWEYVDSSQTAEQTAGTAVGAVSLGVTGLTSGFFYSVRLVAYNTAGTGYGEYVSFATDYGPNDARLVSVHEAGRAQ